MAGLLILAAVTIGGLHAVASHRQASRAANFDEAEFLHATWLLSRRQVLYRDFTEDHTPFLVAMLRPLKPRKTTYEFPRLDVFKFLVRARILMFILGTLGAACAAALAYRISRRPSAAIVTAAAILGSYLTWLRGIADVRNDPPSLLLFWGGALLLLWNRSPTRAAALRAGTGMALVVVSAMWNPKWPLGSLVLGVAYLVIVVSLVRRGRPRLALWALVPPVVIPAGASIVIFYYATLRDYWFFTFTYNAAITKWFYTSHMVWRAFWNKPGFFNCPATFKGLWPLLACALVALALVWPRVRAAWAGLDRGAAVVVLAIVGASGLEIRFIYPYPRLWPQYYLMWAFALAVVYGLVPGALAALWRWLGLRVRWREGLVLALEAAVVLATVLLYVRGTRDRLKPPQSQRYWKGISYLQRELKDDERVWIQPDSHPIAAIDASYYWFAFADLIPAALNYSAAHPEGRYLPPLADADLPVCQLERGQTQNLRFVSAPHHMLDLPETYACFQRLQGLGILAPTAMPGVFEVRHP